MIKPSLKTYNTIDKRVTHLGEAPRVFCNSRSFELIATKEIGKVTCKICLRKSKIGRPKKQKS